MTWPLSAIAISNTYSSSTVNACCAPCTLPLHAPTGLITGQGLNVVAAVRACDAHLMLRPGVDIVWRFLQVCGLVEHDVRLGWHHWPWYSGHFLCVKFAVGAVCVLREGREGLMRQQSRRLAQVALRRLLGKREMHTLRRLLAQLRHLCCHARCAPLLPAGEF